MENLFISAYNEANMQIQSCHCRLMFFSEQSKLMDPGTFAETKGACSLRVAKGSE